MGTISRTNYSSGATITAALQNSNENTIVNEFNGNIDNDNIKSSAAITASKLNLATVAQVIGMSSAADNWAKGSDIASATTTDIGAMTGNYGDVTGTTTITGLGTIQAGSFRLVRFTGALTLTHNATSLLLPTAANITTAANDVAGFVSLGSGNWKCVFYQRYDGTPLVGSSSTGQVIQVVSTQSGAVATGTTTVPYDDTIPQNTEGTEFVTRAITPGSTSNNLLILFSGHIAASATSTRSGTILLCQDTTANSLAAVPFRIEAADAGYNVQLSHFMAAGTTSSTTFKIRIGNDAASTITFNGYSGGRMYGGVSASSLRVLEIKG